MALSAEKKKEIIANYGGVATNTGSVEAQIAMFTQRITDMTEHLKAQKKDNKTTLSLIKLVGRRKRMLSYLMKTDITRYRDLIAKLGLRK